MKLCWRTLSGYQTEDSWKLQGVVYTVWYISPSNSSFQWFWWFAAVSCDVFGTLFNVYQILFRTIWKTLHSPEWVNYYRVCTPQFLCGTGKLYQDREETRNRGYDSGGRAFPAVNSRRVLLFRSKETNVIVLIRIGPEFVREDVATVQTGRTDI